LPQIPTNKIFASALPKTALDLMLGGSSNDLAQLLLGSSQEKNMDNGN
jgi:hypothetical protein